LNPSFTLKKVCVTVQVGINTGSRASMIFIRKTDILYIMEGGRDEYKNRPGVLIIEKQPIVVHWVTLHHFFKKEVIPAVRGGPDGN